MLTRSLIAAVAVTFAISPPSPATSQENVCIEEVGGVCLKWRKQLLNAPKPREAAVEETLDLSISQRMGVQIGLYELQLYAGKIDGDFGPKTREAIRRHQWRLGNEETGYLDAKILPSILAEAYTSPLSRNARPVNRPDLQDIRFAPPISSKVGCLVKTDSAVTIGAPLPQAATQCIQQDTEIRRATETAVHKLSRADYEYCYAVTSFNPNFWRYTYADWLKCLQERS